MNLEKYRNLFIVAVFVIAFFGCDKLNEDFNPKKYNNPIKIGVVGDVTIGREVAENVFFAIKMAADEINSKGGLTIQGVDREIELVFKNSGGDPVIGQIVINELSALGINTVIGPTVSSVAIPMAELCIENNILMMSYSATIPLISKLNDNNLIWRTCPSDEFSGLIMAQHAYDTLQFRTGAILYRDDQFGNAMVKIIKTKFEAMGGNIIAESSYPVEGVILNKYNFNDELNILLEKNPQVIFAIVYEEEIGKITRDLWYSNIFQNLEIKPKFFLTEGAFPNELIANGQPEVLETILGISSSITKTTNYMLYKSNYISKYKFTPATYSEHAYDALYSIAYAMQKAQSTQPDDYKQFLRLVTGSLVTNQETIAVNVNEFDKAKILLSSGIGIDYDGASGKINFDENGDPHSAFAIWKLNNFNYVETSYYMK